MRKVFSLVGAVLLLFANLELAAQSNCTSCFTLTPDSTQPFVYFGDASCSSPQATIFNYEWFVDGQPTITWPFSFNYINVNTAGSHTITLVVTDPANNCSDTSSQTVFATYFCNATFSASNLGNNLWSFATYGNGSTTANVTWDFGDGTVTSGINAYYMQHSYAAAGSYNVCCTITDTANGGCSANYCSTINTVNAPTCTAFFYTTSIVGNTFTIDGSFSTYDPNNYLFAYSLNGNTIQTSTNPIVTVSSTGPLDVLVLNITDTNGNICSSFSDILFGTGGGSTTTACFFYYPINAAGDSIFLDPTCSILPTNGSFAWNIAGVQQPNTTGSWTTLFSIGATPVTLTVLDSLGVAVDSVNSIVYVTPPPCTSCLSVNPIAGSTSDYLLDANCSGAPAGSGKYYYWSIDNNWFTTTSPTYNYQFTQSGTYNVCVSSVDSLGNSCQQTCTTVTVNTPPVTSFDICGTVFTDNLNSPIFWYPQAVGANQAKVYLVTLQPGGQLDAIDSTLVDANGQYCFNNKPIFDYRIKAALESTAPTYANNIPTYYNYAAMWYDAQVITLSNQNQYGKDIYMLWGVNTGGPGIISGNVFQGANKPARSGDPLDGFTLMVVDAVTGKFVTHAKVEIGGSYTIPNLPIGKYKVYGELLNRTSIPALVEITGSATTVTNINLEVNKNNIIPTTANAPTSIGNIPVVINADIKPNPAENYFELLSATEDATATITDAMGKKVQAIELKQNQTQKLDCSSWPRGFYTVRIQTSKGNLVEKLIIK